MEERKIHMEFEKKKGIRLIFNNLIDACREGEHLNGIDSCELLK